MTSSIVIPNSSVFSIDNSLNNSPSTYFNQLNQLKCDRWVLQFKKSLVSAVIKLIPIGVLIGTSYAISSCVNYLLFHTLVEIFSINVAFTTAVLAFHTRHIADKPLLLALGCSYCFTGGLDLAHMLAYKGMNIMKFNNDPNAATQLHIAARVLESGSMLIVLFFGNQFKRQTWIPWLPSIVLTISTFLSLCSVFWWKNFPVCYNIALTPFKKNMEYVICSTWLLVLALLVRPWWPERIEKSIKFDLAIMGKNCHEWLILGVILSIMGEVMFTLYVDVYGLLNIVGHCLKVSAYWCWYRAIVYEMLKDPYTLLFSSIVSTNSELLNTRQALHTELVATRKAWQERTSFMAMMSHELRTPLNGISGMLELVEHSNLDNDQRTQLSTVRGAIECMTVVINDLLDFFKLEAGKISLESIPISVTELANSVMSLYRQHMAPGVQAIVDGPPESYRYVGDPTRLRQVLCNLVSNSAKFTSSGRITLTVTPIVTGPESPFNGVQFTLQDTGVGIPPDRLPKLFQPFVQADETIQRRYGGTGLGLHIVKQLVDLMGGTISVESTHNVGTTFKCQFPLAPYLSNTTNTQATVVKPSIPKFPGFVIAAVDDTPLNLTVLQGFSRRVDCEVKLLSSGQQALDFFTDQNADLCLMDIWMPGMNGVETTRKLRDMGVVIPVVALTADTSTDMTATCFAEFDRVAHKPLKFQDFIDVVSTFYIKENPQTLEHLNP